MVAAPAVSGVPVVDVVPSLVTDGFGTLDALDVLGVVMTPEPEPQTPARPAARRRRSAAAAEQTSLFEEAG